MTKKTARFWAALACLTITTAAQADEAGCIAARYGAAGKYAACEAKASSRGFDDAAYLKCRQKYAAAWGKLASRFPGTSCVGARFTDNGSTITDNLTQLVWEKKTSPVGSGANASDRHDVDNTYLWTSSSTNADGAAFIDFLDDLNSAGFAGQHDWRLPTLFEVQTILATDASPCGTPPCVVDPLFLPSVSSAYWSSSTYQQLPSSAWFVAADNGFTGVASKTNSYAVRAVRGGN